MTRRYFIRCPLDAALAAKNHGFKFNGEYKGENYQDINPIGYIPLINHGVAKLLKFYIHPDSLPLLEPMVGDAIYGKGEVSWSGAKYEYCCRISSIDEQCYNLSSGPDLPKQEYLDDSDESFMVIRRNGKPFPTIEHEDVE